MSSTAKNTSNENNAPELEPRDSAQVKLEEAMEHLEPETDQTDKTVGFQNTEDDYSQIYRQKNVTKKALTVMGGISLAAGSVTAASLGIGGALLLDYYGEDKTYSLEKAEQLHTQVEDYLEKAEL